MGYYCKKEIASVVEPKEITLANNPNFVVFSSKGNKNDNQKTRVEIDIIKTAFDSEFDDSEAAIEEMGNLAKGLLYLEIRGSTSSNDTYSFQGTYNRTKVDNKTFYVAREGEKLNESNKVLSKDEALAITASNLKECFMQNRFLRNNFEISIFDSMEDGGVVKPGHKIEIISKGVGSQYNFSIEHGKMYYSGKNPDYIMKVNATGFTDEMIEYDVFSYGYTSPETGGFPLRFLTAVFADDPFAQTGQTVLYRPQETGLSWDECNKKTLTSLANNLSNQYAFRFLFDVVLNTKEWYIELYYTKNAELYFPYATSFSPNVGSLSRFSEEDHVFITSSVTTSSSSDTIDYGTGSYQIELDVYTGHQLPLGGNDGLNLGNYLTTLSKSYFGQPVWFDLSTLLSKKLAYSSAFLTELELDPKEKGFRLWSDAGTVTDYRFIAKRTDGIINETLYYSSPLYAVNGYDYTLNPLNLEKDDAGNSYILDFSQNFYTNIFTRAKPLTTRFNRTHIRGQKQYFNYLHKYYWTGTREWGVDNPLPSIGLRYKLYTQSGTFINEYTLQGQEDHEFSKANTTLLRLDQFLPVNSGKTVGRIDVYLCRWHKSQSLGKNEPEVIISMPLSFRILPEEINDVNDFVFLNRLGGWDSMNFGGGFSSEFKAAGSTIYKTLQPDFNLQSEIEKVAMKSVQEQKVVQTSPITSDVVDWLREMSASPAVYELKTKRYIIVDDMALKYNSTDDLYQVEMKYHYTDTFK